jgi:hypothetical protein
MQSKLSNTDLNALFKEAGQESVGRFLFSSGVGKNSYISCFGKMVLIFTYFDPPPQAT